MRILKIHVSAEMQNVAKCLLYLFVIEEACICLKVLHTYLICAVRKFPSEDYQNHRDRRPQNDRVFANL